MLPIAKSFDARRADVDINPEGKVVTGVASGAPAAASDKKKYIFSIVPKQRSSPFFSVVQTGCLDRAKKLQNVECWYNGTELVDVFGQSEIIRDLVAEGVDGIAVAIADATYTIVEEAIAFAVDSGVPVITFDSDAVHSKRLTYIGTDNYAFGAALGKILLQIDPTGGYYGVVSTTAPNAMERERGLKDRLEGPRWIEHSASPVDCLENGSVAIGKMRELSSFPEMKSIIPVGGWPMSNVTSWKHFIDEYPNITTIGGDTLPHQMDLLKRGYVMGLVGQVPFQMGENAMDILLAHKKGKMIPKEIVGTSLLEVVTVPMDLPNAKVDMHYIGNLKYLGFTLSAVVIFLGIGFGVWTYFNRNLRAVRASQPIFLIMIAVGAVIMGASMIPMSFDDGNPVFDTQSPCVTACMGSVWLSSIGFTTVFSALYSKTWRVNKLFNNPNRFIRVKVKASDSLCFYGVLLLANVLTLALFTALAPLEIVRQSHAGTDDWNRIISTFGTCQSTTDRWGGATPYYVTIMVINLTVLILAILQAYQARSIPIEFSESRYIITAVASMLQTAVIAFPILFLVRESPEVSYVLKICVVFINCIVILLCIFVPKISRREVESRTGRRSSGMVGSSAGRQSSDDPKPTSAF